MQIYLGKTKGLPSPRSKEALGLRWQLILGILLEKSPCND